MAMNPDVSFAQRIPKKIQKSAQKHFPDNPEMAQMYARELMKIISKTSTSLTSAESTLQDLSKSMYKYNKMKEASKNGNTLPAFKY